MSTIGIGVIGCGGMGRFLMKKVLTLDSRVRVAGLFDPDARSVEEARREIGADVRVYDDYRALVASPEVDWVMIASWNCYHREQVVAAFEAGKHVFCQKPLATTLPDCRAMLDAWRRSGKMFTIGFTLRYSPHYRKIRELVAAGAIGYIVSMEYNETLNFNHGGYIMGDWRRMRKWAGTHLLEKCCHDIDLANWIVGSRARRVASFGGLNFFTPQNKHHQQRLGKDKEGRLAYAVWPGLVMEDPFTGDKDIIDNQVAILEYENQARATFHTNCQAGIPERRMYILGSEGAIRADVLTGTIELQRVGWDTTIENISAGVAGGHGGGDDYLAEELVASMTRGAPPSVGLKEGVESSVTCFAIDDAMDTGRVVDLAPYWHEVGLAD